MDISAITNIISNLGFPIASCLCLAWFGWYMVKNTNEINAKNMEQVQNRCKEREEKLYEEIKANREINAKAIETIAHYAEKLDVIQSDIKEIKQDVSMIMIGGNRND